MVVSYDRHIYDGDKHEDKMQKQIYVTKPSMSGLEEYVCEIKDLWESKRLTNMGEKHEQLEDKLQQYLDTPNITLFANGHLALEYGIQVFGLTGEVITTPFTFASTTCAIVRSGLVPVFCDIDPNDFTIDTDKIERLITDKTSAIIPVHVYGRLCDTDSIEYIAMKNGLTVIYDAAHAFGVKGAANHGDASVFSLHATKVFHTVEGGCVCFRNAKYKPIVDRLKNFGIESDCGKAIYGGNGKMSEFHAAMGLCNLRYIDSWIEKRKALVQRYLLHLREVNGIQMMYYPDESNYAYLPALFGSMQIRDKVYEALKRHNIFARKYFYPLTSSYENNYSMYCTPVAYDVAQRVLVLPLYPDLQHSDVDRICTIILAQLSEAKS